MGRYAIKRRVAVETQSPWTSRINAIQAIGVGAMLITLSGNTHNKAIAVGVITAVQGIVTWILNTWFTPTVTATSVPNHPPVPSVGPVRPPLN